MLTPLDIQKREFKRSFRGYNEAEVDQFLDQVVQNYEILFMENKSLKDKLENSEASRARYQEMEKVIKDAVIMAQKNAEDLERNARQEAEMLLEEARLRSERMIAEAGAKAGAALREAQQQAQGSIAEAREKVKSLMDEYYFLEKQVNMFRVKFRSFLEAQLSLLEGQEQEARELVKGEGWLEAAAGWEPVVPKESSGRSTGEVGDGGAEDAAVEEAARMNCALEPADEDNPVKQ